MEEKNNKVTFRIDKEENFSEWFSDIIQKAEITDIRYNVKGFVVIRPWGALLIEKMNKLYENELQANGHSPCFFPTLIPEENFKKEASHVEGFTPQVFWLKETGEEKLALRPTSETAFYQLYSLWLRSYRDLPLKLYQRANVFRYETKATRPLIRSREFMWIEAHDVFLTRKEAEGQVQEDIAMTERIMHKKFGIPFLPLKRPSWDKFPGAEYTFGSDSLMPDGKLIQQPSTHLLGQNFSKAFDIKVKNESGKEEHVWQTCYGPAISRILASLVAIHGDNSGLVIPFSISPIQVVIVPIYRKENKKEVDNLCIKLKDELENADISVKFDNSDKKPGDKFYFWEMKGVPLRIEIGEEEVKSKEITLFLRDSRKKLKVKLSGLVKEILNHGRELDTRLMNNAGQYFKKSIKNAQNKSEIEKIMREKGIARCNFCSIDKEGEKCAGIIEKELQASVRGARADKKEKADGKCIICGKKANEIVYVGKSY